MKTFFRRFVTAFGQEEPWAIHTVLMVLFAVHGGLVCWSAARHAPTVDEPFHLAAGIRRLQHGEFDIDRGNPPLVGDLAAAAVILADPQYDWSRVPKTFQVGRDFLEANGTRSLLLLTIGRWALLPISLLGATVCYLWARDLFGRQAGVVASALWCFSPNVIAAAQLITGDTAAFAFGLAAGYTTWRWLRTPTWTNCLWAGLAVGLAETSKYVWVLLYVLIPALFVVTRVIQWLTGQLEQASIRRQALQLILLLLIAVEVVTIAYHGKGLFTRVDEYDVSERFLRHVPDRMAEILGPMPVPFPHEYLRGIDEIAGRDKAKPRSYLNGEWTVGGFRYYYLYAAVYKFPLGYLILLAAAVLIAVRRSGGRSGWLDELVLLAFFLATLVFVSMTTVGQRLRYGYPAVPFLMVFASRVAATSLSSRALGGARIPRRIAAIGVGMVLVESLWVYPHSLSFFNVWAGGPKNGHAHLLDSNIDWGQELLPLREWVNQHPEAQPLHLAFFGVMDPELLGLQYQLPPKFYNDMNRDVHVPFDQQGPLPGWHIVSVNYLRGAPWRAPTGDGRIEFLSRPYYAYFLRFEPVDRIGYGLNVYHLGEEEVNRVRKEMGLPPLAGK